MGDKKFTEIIKEILTDAVQAPSGENCQPWHFVVKGNNVDVFNIPERDHSLYNVDQKGSYVAHGALLENIRIAAIIRGYSIVWKIFPKHNEASLVANIEFLPTSPVDDPLFRVIHDRATNRKPFHAEDLSKEERGALMAEADLISEAGFILIEDFAKKNILADLFRAGEYVLFENKLMHDFLFSHIVWTQEEEQKKRMGMYFPTLELRTAERIIFRLIRSWGVLSFFNFLGLSKKIASQTAENYRSCSAFGVITIPSNTAADFVQAGRLLQRLWLQATLLGLSVQPITAIPFLHQRISVGKADSLSPRHIRMIEDAYKNIIAACNIKFGTVSIIFRVGRSDGPSARSSRLPPVIKFV